MRAIPETPGSLGFGGFRLHKNHVIGGVRSQLTWKIELQAYLGRLAYIRLQLAKAHSSDSNPTGTVHSSSRGLDSTREWRPTILS